MQNTLHNDTLHTETSLPFFILLCFPVVLTFESRSMAALYTLVLSTSKMHTTLSLEKMFVVDVRLLLTVKSLYSCLEVSICVGGVNSRPFTVGVEFRKGVCAVATSYILYEIDRQSQPSR